MKKQYSTVTVDSGVNYREIAETMSDLGFKMNHSSARNHVIRIMEKFAKAIVNDEATSSENLSRIAKSSSFQSALAILLQKIELNRRDNQS